VTFRFTLNTLITCIIYIVGKKGCYTAGSVSPPCQKFDVVVVLLAGGASRALLRTTGSVVSCLLCFVCRGCVVAGLGGRWWRCRTAFPSSFSWWWSAGFSVLGCRWYILVEICWFSGCCLDTFTSMVLGAAFVRFFFVLYCVCLWIAAVLSFCVTECRRWAVLCHVVLVLAISSFSGCYSKGFGALTLCVGGSSHSCTFRFLWGWLLLLCCSFVWVCVFVPFSFVERGLCWFCVGFWLLFLLPSRPSFCALS